MYGMFADADADDGSLQVKAGAWNIGDGDDAGWMDGWMDGWK